MALRMKKNIFRNTHCGMAIRQMPALRHKLDGEEFSWERSEVAKWMMGQPEVMKYIFDKAHGTGIIVYEATSGTWKGDGLP